MVFAPPPLSTFHCALAAWNRDLCGLRKLRSLGYTWDELTVTYAAYQGAVDILQYCMREGCPMNEFAPAAAARAGHALVVDILREYKCPFDLSLTVASALEGQHSALAYSLTCHYSAEKQILDVPFCNGTPRCDPSTELLQSDASPNARIPPGTEGEECGSEECNGEQDSGKEDFSDEECPGEDYTESKVALEKSCRLPRLDCYDYCLALLIGGIILAVIIARMSDLPRVGILRMRCDRSALSSAYSHYIVSTQRDRLGLYDRVTDTFEFALVTNNSGGIGYERFLRSRGEDADIVLLYPSSQASVLLARVTVRLADDIVYFDNVPLSADTVLSLNGTLVTTMKTAGTLEQRLTSREEDVMGCLHKQETLWKAQSIWMIKDHFWRWEMSSVQPTNRRCELVSLTWRL